MLASEDSSALLNTALHWLDDMKDILSAPSVIYRPKLSLDGNLWCALYGENLQDGIAGFGDSPEQAMKAFDEAFKTQRIKLVVTEVKASLKQVVHPGAILKGYMCAQQMGLDYLSKYSSISYCVLSDFLDLKIGITKEMPAAFHTVLHTDPQMWLDAQEAWDRESAPKNGIAVIPPVHPAELLKSYMHSAGISVNFLATGGNLDINELKDFLECKIDMTLKMRLAFTRVLHTKPEIWVDAQNAWKKGTFISFPKPPQSPAELLAQILDIRGMSVDVLARKMDVQISRVQEVLDGKESPDLPMRLAFARVLDMPEITWHQNQEAWNKYNGI